MELKNNPEEMSDASLVDARTMLYHATGYVKSEELFEVRDQIEDELRSRGIDVSSEQTLNP